MTKTEKKDYLNLKSFITFNKENLENIYNDTLLELEGVEYVYVIDFQELYAYAFSSESNNNLSESPVLADDVASKFFFENPKEKYTFLEGTWFELINHLISINRHLSLKNSDVFKSLEKYFKSNTNDEIQFNTKEIKNEVLDEMLTSFNYETSILKIIKLIDSEYFFDLNDFYKIKKIEMNNSIFSDLYNQLRNISSDPFSSKTRKSINDKVDAYNLASTINLNRYFDEGYEEKLFKKKYHFSFLTHTKSLFGISNYIININKNYSSGLNSSIIRSPINVIYQRKTKSQISDLKRRIDQIKIIKDKCDDADHELVTNYYIEDSNQNSILRINNDLLRNNMQIKEIDLDMGRYTQIKRLFDDEFITEIIRELKQITKNGYIDTLFYESNTSNTFFFPDTLKYKNLLNTLFLKISDQIPRDHHNKVDQFTKILDKLSLTLNTTFDNEMNVEVIKFCTHQNEKLLTIERYEDFTSFYWNAAISVRDFLNHVTFMLKHYHDESIDMDQELYYIYVQDSFGDSKMIEYDPMNIEFGKESFPNCNVIRVNCPEFSFHIDFKRNFNEEPMLGIIMVNFQHDLLDEVITKMSYHPELVLFTKYLDKIWSK